jgi:hypothetical protein
MVKELFLKIIIFIPITILLLSISSCVKNIATGERQLVILSEAEENNIGAKEHPNIIKSFAPILFSSASDNITNCLSPVAIFFTQLLIDNNKIVIGIKIIIFKKSSFTIYKLYYLKYLHNNVSLFLHLGE